MSGSEKLLVLCLHPLCVLVPAEPEADGGGAETGQNPHPLQRLRGGVRRSGL